jgi:hypothetical protein
MWDGRAQLEKIKMTRRVSATKMVASQPNPSTPRNSFPRLQDILVNLSVKDTPKVVRRLKLIGDPISFTEFTDKVYIPNPTNDPSLRGKTQRVPFPDADLNKSFVRIGHDDPKQCPWKKMGYVGSTQYAQNVLEKQEDGSWEAKILKKGKSIFNRIAEQTIQNYEDQENEDGDGRHYGTRNSPCVKITATATGQPAPLSVDYTLYFEGKPTFITDDMIELLRKAGEPSTEDLMLERVNYNKDREDDPNMPEWEDFFTYGFPLTKIFKFTVPKNADAEVATASYKVSPPVEAPKPVAKPAPVVEDEDDDDDDEEFVPAPKPTRVPKKSVVLEEDDEDEDGPSLGWMGKK